ncbi:MAG: epoxyqueuosine reductase [Deltaproteobacteria bacterium]|nr:epoxyqueuosine reductase [Deltaproteobacteria bacterium]MBW2306270.1 epoxyqueuosine reductase [Deltaproteobacteria bacterium]
MENTSNPEEMLKEIITGFVRESRENKAKAFEGQRYWDDPLVGFADGGDSLFHEYKKIIGDFHMTPAEALGKVYPAEVDEKSPVFVISWILPASEAVRASNRNQTELPSKFWSHARNFGEICNMALRDHVVAALRSRGYRAVAPFNAQHFRRLDDTPVGIASNWSERHVAHACGLGTFGLSDGLITQRGKAMRCGSVVTDMPLTPTPRPYKIHTEYCLFSTHGTCGECIGRCPSGAISEAGHDKEMCWKYVYNKVKSTVNAMYGVVTGGCGLCQAGVACEACIPEPKT